jgi:hypothetical protein
MYARCMTLLPGSIGFQGASGRCDCSKVAGRRRTRVNMHADTVTHKIEKRSGWLIIRRVEASISLSFAVHRHNSHNPWSRFSLHIGDSVKLNIARATDALFAQQLVSIDPVNGTAHILGPVRSAREKIPLTYDHHCRRCR